MLRVLRAVRNQVVAHEPERRTLRAATGIDIDAGLSGHGYYRAMGSGFGTMRDLDSMDQRANIERGYQFLDSFPLANRTVTLMQEWAAGGEFSVSAKHESIQNVVNRHYKDPRNEYERRNPLYLEALMQPGELAIPCHVNPVDGTVLLDYFDPADIMNVLLRSRPSSNIWLEWILYEAGMRTIQDPDDPTKTKAAPGRIMCRVINPVFDRSSAHFGRLMGEPPTTVTDIHGVLYFRSNCRLNSRRGKSDFYPSMDPYAVYDDIMAAGSERMQFLSRLMGQVKFTGADDGKLQERSARYSKIPGYAAVSFTNENEDWSGLRAPDSNAGDFGIFEQILRQYASASGGIPPHILVGDFGSGTRAVAADASDPAYLRAAAKQNALKRVIRTACTYAVDCAYVVNPAQFVDDAGQPLPSIADAPEEWELDVHAPSLLRKDPAIGAAIVQQVASALLVGLQSEMIDRETAREIFLQTLEEIGAEPLDAQEIGERIAVERLGRMDAQTKVALAQIAKQRELGPVAVPSLPVPGVPAPTAPAPAEAKPVQPAPTEPAPAEGEALAAAKDVKVGFITGATAIVEKAQAGIISRESALGLLEVTMGLSRQDAEKCVADAGLGKALPAPKPLEPAPAAPTGAPA